MKLRTLILLGLATALPVVVTAAQAASRPGPEPPRLVLLIVVDQMRYDYLPRFASSFTGGFRELMERGAVFTNANLDHYPSVTAVGHATTLTGAPPSVSGIVGNDWYDRRERKNVTSVEDEATTLLGAGEPAPAGSSPHRLMVSTVGDELKMTGRGSHVVGLSLKDRAAILPAGRMADVALWWDTRTGAFVTSTWYGRALPAWAADFNARRPADAWLGQEWRGLSAPGASGDLFARLPDAAGPGYYGRVYGSAFGNDLLEELAEAALAGAHLGEDDATDVLTVSFSSNDAVGHARGPDSPEVRDITVRTDLAVGRLLKAVDERVGLARTLVVLTSDHGVAPVPEQMHEWKMPAGRLSREELMRAATQALEAAYGPGPWIEGRAGSDLYLDRARMAKQGLDPAAVERTAAAGAETLASVWRAYTRSQLLEGRVPPDPWSQRVLKSFNRVRSGDVDVLLEPYWMSGTEGTTHGTPWSYDTHIPLVLMGPAVRAGRYDRSVALNDLAPTLATVLGVETPSGSSGHALAEILAR